MQIKIDRSQIVLALVAIFLVIVNLVLISQNVQLRRTVDQSKLLITEEGYTFATLKIKGSDGHEGTVDLSDGKLKTLLLVFNTSCRYCMQQYPYWKESVNNIDSRSWRILAVTSEDDYDKVKNHLREHELGDITVGLISEEDMRNARMLYTPMTLVVDSNGEVKKVWPGLWKKAFDL